MTSALNPSSLAEATKAGDFEMSGSIGVASVEVFGKNGTSEPLCAFCTAPMRALDLPAEFR